MPTTEKFITCTFSDGMLASEYSVTILSSGQKFSLFAPKNSVEVTDKNKGLGLLRVRLVDPRNNVISLPGEIIEQGRRFIEFPPEEMKSV